MHIATIDSLLEYEIPQTAHFLFHIEAAFHDGHRIIEERLTITPSMKIRHYSDDRTGNRFVRLDAPRGMLTINYHAKVEIVSSKAQLNLPECPVSSLPDEVLRYLMPSRYCESDSLGRAAQQMFGQLPPGIQRVQAISDWIYGAIEYLPGYSDASTTAQEVFVQRAGVCRDFAHLGITLCRALNIPARLVVGYVNFAAPPQDFHAVFEAWLDQQWVMFDPTQKTSLDRLVRVGTGRDAKDVAFATVFGQVRLLGKTLRIDESEQPADAISQAGD
jgi:transglutaminase-like putative cysteine protease